MNTRSRALGRMSLMGSVATAALLCMALPQQALSAQDQSKAQQQSQQSEMQKSAMPSQAEFDRMLQTVREARTTLESASRAGSDDVRQARQDARNALQQIEQELTRADQSGSDRMQQSKTELKQQVREAQDQLADDRGKLEQEAQALQKVERTLQQMRRQVSDAGTGESRQARATGDQSGEQTRVRVQQPPAKVEVERAKPDVTVQQPQPKVIIEQEKPEVTVKQPEPKVTIEQAKPDVEVEQPGKANVRVEREKGADVEVKQAADAAREDRSQAGDQAQAEDERPARADTGQAADEDERTLPAAESSGYEDDDAAAFGQGSAQQARQQFGRDQLMGRDVELASGENIGEVEDVLMNGSEADAILVDVGGFLGIGERRVAVPTDKISMVQDQVYVQMTMNEIEELPEHTATN